MAVEILQFVGVSPDTGIGVNPYSVRGMTQTFEPIDSSISIRRTINGALVDISLNQFKKLATTVGCEDMQVPLLDNIYPGKVVDLYCVADLGYDTTEGQSASRPIIPGTLRQIGVSTVWLYKPILRCMVMSWEIDCEMWGKEMSWAIDFEEV